MKNNRTMNLFAAALACTLVHTSNAKAQEPSRYMGGPAELATAPNGAIVNKSTLMVFPQIVYASPTVEKIADGVWVIGGYSVANMSVIEAPEGLIVYDTGDNAEEGRHFLAAIREKISQKPIKAIIYSHSHYALGGGALVDDPNSVIVIGHPKLNDTVKANLAGGGAPSAIPEIGPVLTARAAVQFNNFVPDKGPDAALGGKIVFGKETAFLPVSRPVQDGEELDVAGLKLQFFTKYTSDDYCVTVWIPSMRTVLNNFLWPGTPNLYTLRGGTYRDPREWRDGLRVIRNLQPEVILTTHTRPVVGKDKALDTLTRYMDQITLEFDQTLRGILLGLGPDDLRYFVKVPPRMAELPLNAETYGKVSFYPPAIYQYAIGWYDRDTTTIHEIAPRGEAERLVALMGGRDKVLAASKSALEKREYSWAAQLVNYLYKLDPRDNEVRQVQADALRKLGQLSVGSIPRAFLISEALALEGKVQIPIMVPPSPTAIAGSAPDFVDYFRVRIDPVKSANADRVVKFVFIGAINKSVGLHIRGGIAEFIDNPDTYYRKPDLTLQLSPETWAKVYLNQITISDAITSGELKVTQGDTEELVGLFNLFDRFDAAQNVTIPPDMDDER